LTCGHIRDLWWLRFCIADRIVAMIGRCCACATSSCDTVAIFLCAVTVSLKLNVDIAVPKQ